MKNIDKIKKSLLTKRYSVRVRLILFVIVAVLLVISISFTAVIGLNNTYNSLSNLRDRSLNQMFFSMTLGVKTTQISTYATRLSQTIRALEYKEASEQLEQHIQQVHDLLDKMKKYTSAEEGHLFFDIVHAIEYLERSVKDLLSQAHQRHIINTFILSKLNQSLLYLRHIERLENRTSFSHSFLTQLLKIENLIEDATRSSFSTSTFLSIQSTFSFLPEFNHPQSNLEWVKVEKEFKEIIKKSQQLSNVNLRIQFLTYQIDSLTKKIDQGYTQLAKEKTTLVNESSDQIQNTLSRDITSIFIFALFTIGLIIILGSYIYHLFGKRLHSITLALTQLSQGDKNIKVPQQQKQDEIGDLARAFDIFQQNVEQLAHTDALLKEKSELLEQTYFAMRDGLAIFDRNNVLVSCNKQFSVLLNQGNQISIKDIYELAEILNKEQAKIYGTDKYITQELLTEIRYQQEPLEITFNQLVLEWRISSLQDGGLVAFLIDRTQRKKLETDLAHSQKMRTIGHLTGGIAHDFNNFLAVIIGNLDLIDPNTLSQSQAKRLQRALKAAENSATLTQRLLAYARKQPLHPMQLDINRLVRDFSDFMKHSLPPTITIKLDLEEIPFVYIDKNQLETALVNLVVNAKDALNGEGIIMIKTCQKLVQRTYNQEQMVQLSIIDKGCGMDEKTQKRIFEPFFTTKQNGKGSGLGLSMVYGFIRQSKGRVIVNSILGQGTTVHLQLPISKDIAKIAPLLTPEEKTAHAESILLVEDQESLRETLVEQLHNLGYSTVGVRTAEQAISYMSKEKSVDYLLSDIVLSGKLTGVDVAKHVQLYCPQTKILLMTGNYSENIEKMSELPILEKPFRLDELEKKLSSL